VGLLAPVRSYIDGLVHSSAERGDAAGRATVERLRIEPRLRGPAEQPSNIPVKQSA
jgi:hypothetical protein